jgi:hypothetical protein
MLLASHLAMVLCLGLGLTSADTSVGVVAPAPATDESPRAIKALELYNQQRLLEAAVAFEGLWHDFRVPAYLFNAAIARERLGHEAQAYVHLRRFLAEPVSAEEKATATRRVEELKVRTIPLRIEVAGAPGPQDLSFVLQKMPAEEAIKVEASLLAVPGTPGTYEVYVDAGSWLVSPVAAGYQELKATADAQPATPATLSFRMEPGLVPFSLVVEPPDALTAGVRVRVLPKGGGDPQEFQLTGRPTELALAPGEYSVELSAPNFKPAALEIDLRSGLAIPPIVLQPVELSETPTENSSNRALAIGFGAASAALLVGGGVTLGISMPKYASTRDEYLNVSANVLTTYTSNQWNERYLSLRRNLQGQAVGFALVGGALGGLIATALTPLKDRRKVVATEIGVGAAALVGSTIAYAVIRGRLSAQLREDDAHVKKYDDSVSSAQMKDGELSSTAESLGSRAGSSNATTFLIGTGAAVLAAGVFEWACLSRRGGRSPVSVGATNYRHGGMITVSGAF